MDTGQILPNLPPAAKILFVRLRSLGDTILSTPLFTALKSWRPDLLISVLVEHPYNEVLLNNPDLHEILIVRSRGHRLSSMMMERLRVLRKLRAGRFDCCINLHGGSTSALLTGLSGGRFRVGLQSFRNSQMYNVLIPVPPAQDKGQKQHTVEYQMKWLYALGMPAAVIPPLRVVADPSLETQCSGILRNAGVNLEKPYCVVQPTSRFHTKEWTAQGFAEITNYLIEERGLQVLLIGEPSEARKLEQVLSSCRRGAVRLSSLSIAELIWIISKARLFVGNDSGPTHLAAALQVPAVVLFGSSDSQVWYPWRARHEVVQNTYVCNPCPGYFCQVYEEPKCILSVTSCQVRKAIERILTVTTDSVRS